MFRYEAEYNGQKVSFEHDRGDLKESDIEAILSQSVGQQEAPKPSTLEAVGLGALESAVGTAMALPAGAAVGGVGRAVGTALGGLVGKTPQAAMIGGNIGQVGGQLIGGFAGMALGQKLQDVGEKALLPEDVNAQYQARVEAARNQAPVAFTAGSVAAGLPFSLPNPKNVKNAIDFTRKLVQDPKLAASILDTTDKAVIDQVNNLFNVGLGLGVGAGADVVNQLTDDKEGFNLLQTTVAGLGGALLNEPTKAGKFLSLDGLTRLQEGETVRKKIYEPATVIAEKMADDTIRLQQASEVAARNAIANGEDPEVVNSLTDIIKNSATAVANSQKRAIEPANEMVVQLSTMAKDLPINDANSGKPATWDYKQEVFFREIDEYARAKHALDFNAQKAKENAKKLGLETLPNSEDYAGAGISIKDARAKIAEFQQKPYFDQLEAGRKRLVDASRKILDEEVAGGRISKDTADTLKAVYPEYVPLERVIPEEDVFGFGQQFKDGQPTLTTVRKAKGSDKEVISPLQTTLSRINQAQRNAVRNEHLKLFAANVEAAPKSWGDSLEVYRPDGDGFVTKTGKKATVDDIKGKSIRFKVDGQDNYIKIQDPEIYKIVAGQTKVQAPAWVNAIFGTYTRAISSLITKYNPAFWVTNAFRDAMDSFVNTSAMYNSIAKGLELFKYYPEALSSYSDFVSGRDTVGARMFREMKEAGMEFGGLAGLSRGEVANTLKDMRKMATSQVYKNFKKISEAIDIVNEAIESAPRYAAYKLARESGLSITKAVSNAKNVTVDFGTSGAYSPVLRSLYMFYNPSVQGSLRTLRSLNNPKVAMVVAGTALAGYMAIHRFNKAQDENYEQKVYDFDLKSGIPIVLGTDDEGKFRYLTIPVSWGLRPVLQAARYNSYILNGQEVKPEVAAKDMVLAIAESYNPVGGTDLLSAAAPTIADLPLQLAQNRSWTGATIRPGDDQLTAQGVRFKDVPVSERFYSSLEKDMLGRNSIEFARGLKDLGADVNPNDLKYVVETLTGGLGRFLNRVATTTGSLAQGELPSAAQTPFVSSFLKERYEEYIPVVNEIDARNNEALNQALAEEKLRRLNQGRQEDKMFNEIRRLPLEEQGRVIQQIEAANPSSAMRILARLQAKENGLTSTERQLAKVPVKDGTRARLILQVLSGIEDPGEREDFYLKMVERGIITDAVKKQLAESMGIQ